MINKDMLIQELKDKCTDLQFHIDNNNEDEKQQLIEEMKYILDELA